MASSKRAASEGKYCRDWEEEEDLKVWLCPVAGDHGKAACRFCKGTMPAGYSDLRLHMATAEHQKHLPPGCSVPSADEGLGDLKHSGSGATIPRRTEALFPSASSPKAKEEEMDEALVRNRNGNSAEVFQFSAEPTLEDIRRLQSGFTAERGWGKYHQPRNLLLALVGEVGELAELFQWREEAPEGLPGWTVPEREALSDELSDVLIYLVALADKCRVDLPSAALRKIGKNRLKYPAERVYGSSKKYTEYEKQQDGAAVSSGAARGENFCVALGASRPPDTSCEGSNGAGASGLRQGSASKQASTSS
ncbi:dCTP pyrophosphatase 1 [Podarcis lilfordi]|uniref:dCTP pyrophosphatase 1 n=1 Tax=Podarcis lilfordi TaxID=74358 RepID=A0AA35PM60_9SAUR|nr:dCTP pyrophosphatase 1 [Podarcis lilfordi]